MEALGRKGWDYVTDEGGGAFYGPKIDIKIQAPGPALVTDRRRVARRDPRHSIRTRDTAPQTRALYARGGADAGLAVAVPCLP